MTTSQAATRELAALLGTQPESLTALEHHREDDVRHLTASVRHGMARDDQEVDEGMNQALRFVPGMLRGTAKKMLFGGK